MNINEKYLSRCIELAKNGLGTTYPNPMVGAVIVYDGKIIGEGWHKKSGEPHAEVIAINSVKDKSLLSKSTLYVSLEPCSHHGKTPPCADLVIQYNIPKVVIGTLDPNPTVAGNGLKKLVEKGIETIVGILEEECNELNKRFFTFHQKNRPYIILKWAESKDGFVAPLKQHEQKPYWITNEFSRQLVHKWRSEEHAILVGTNTVLKDNPKLDVRDWQGINPIRIVLDKEGIINETYNILNNSSKTIIISEKENFSRNEHCMYENAIFDNTLAEKVCLIAKKHHIQSMIIEGGTKTLNLFIESGLWDEARVFIGDVVFNNGIVKPYFNEIKHHSIFIGNDELTFYKNL